MADREGPRVEIVDVVRRWESGNSQRRGRQHSQPERGRQCSAQQRRPSGRERADCRFLRVAQAGELFPVAMNHMDGVVNADPDRERRDDGVRDAQQRHGAQHTDEHEHDGTHRDDRQRRLAQRQVEEYGQDGKGRRNRRGDRLRLSLSD